MSTSSSRPRGQAAAAPGSHAEVHRAGPVPRGRSRHLIYSSPQTATSDERRKGLTAVFKLGLVRYVAETPLADQLKVTFQAPAGPQTAAAVDDPWNFWVFRIGASGNFDGEESNESLGMLRILLRQPDNRPVEDQFQRLEPLQRGHVRARRRGRRARSPQPSGSPRAACSSRRASTITGSSEERPFCSRRPSRTTTFGPGSRPGSSRHLPV